jgi:hypothetical protein
MTDTDHYALSDDVKDINARKAKDVLRIARVLSEHTGLAILTDDARDFWQHVSQDHCCSWLTISDDGHIIDLYNGEAADPVAQWERQRAEAPSPAQKRWEDSDNAIQQLVFHALIRTASKRHKAGLRWKKLGQADKGEKNLRYVEDVIAAMEVLGAENIDDAREMVYVAQWERQRAVGRFIPFGLFAVGVGLSAAAGALTPLVIIGATLVAAGVVTLITNWLCR